MTSITMRNLGDVKTRRREPAADHDRPMEEEVRPTSARAAERAIDPRVAA